MTQTGIQKAVLDAGSQAKLAKKLGVSQQAIQQWHTRGYVPIARVKTISFKTNIPIPELVDPKYVAILAAESEV